MTDDALKTMTELEGAIRWLELNNVTVTFGEGNYYIDEYVYGHNIEVSAKSLIEITNAFQKQLTKCYEDMIRTFSQSLQKAMPPTK